MDVLSQCNSTMNAMEDSDTSSRGDVVCGDKAPEYFPCYRIVNPEDMSDEDLFYRIVNPEDRISDKDLFSGLKGRVEQMLRLQDP
eukprot:8245-Eustigmatos_ZCMA.PRE.1